MPLIRTFFKIPRLLFLIVYFFWEVVLANIRVAVCVMSPLKCMKPGIIGIPLDASSDTEITLLANMITLTPGTLSVDVSGDRKTLYVHTLFAESPNAFRRQIKRSFERKILRVTR